MPIENLKIQMLYTVAEKGAESTELKIIGSMKKALHPANPRLERQFPTRWRVRQTA
ncbi:hypothetical protein ACNKHS_24785 [Shigella flexneri]